MTRAELSALFLDELARVADGSRAFHRERFDRCVQAEEASTCPVDAAQRVHRRCNDVFTGDGNVGEACDVDADCVDGAACTCGACAVLEGRVAPLVDTPEIPVPDVAGAACVDTCGHGPYSPLVCDQSAGICVNRAVVGVGAECDTWGRRTCVDQLAGNSCRYDETAATTLCLGPVAPAGEMSGGSDGAVGVAAPFVPGAAVVSAAVTGGDGCSYE